MEYITLQVLLFMCYKHVEAVVYHNSYFGDHQLTYGVYFNCFGNESSLYYCQTSSTSCDFANAAGVFCRGDEITGTAIILLDYNQVSVNMGISLVLDHI